jgi:hypothetical protein
MHGRAHNRDGGNRDPESGNLSMMTPRAVERVLAAGEN